MKKNFGLHLLLLTLLAGVLGSVRSPAQANGIFADFTTSMGSFTCRLDYAVAPKTVANFIGLATGCRAWLDVPSGQSRTNAFYDGISFHRVIPDFMIQGGSPNGLGTDGPGYSFVDEFSPAARFDGFGVLAMANSGPDSNGSQFFITVASAAHLNDVHSIFGRLTGGSNVVYRISRVARDSNNKPLTNILIQTVQIRRVGAAAEAFDIHTNGLPVVTNLPLAISMASDSATLAFSNQMHADNRLYSSTNFLDWTAHSLGIETMGSITNAIPQPIEAPSEFFKLAQIQYSSTRPAPRSLAGRTLVHSIVNGPTITNFFDLSGGGTYAEGTNIGTIVTYDYLQDAHRGRIRSIVYSGIVPMQLHMAFTTPTNGTYSGTAYLGMFQQPTSIAGSFWMR